LARESLEAIKETVKEVIDKSFPEIEWEVEEMEGD